MSVSPIMEAGILLGRVLVGSILVVAGLLKIRAGAQWFLTTLLAYDLVHGVTAGALSKGLPWIEVICGALLIIGFLTPFATAASFVILVVFTAAIASAILRDKSVDCGCFGRSTKISRARWTLVYRNIALMGLLLSIHAFAGGGLSVDGLLKIWVYNPGRDTVLLTWLTGLWIVSIIMTFTLHTLDRKRAHKTSDHETTEQVQSET